MAQSPRTQDLFPPATKELPGARMNRGVELCEFYDPLCNGAGLVLPWKDGEGHPQDEHS